MLSKILRGKHVKLSAIVSNKPSCYKCEDSGLALVELTDSRESENDDAHVVWGFGGVFHVHYKTWEGPRSQRRAAENAAPAHEAALEIWSGVSFWSRDLVQHTLLFRNTMILSQFHKMTFR